MPEHTGHEVLRGRLARQEPATGAMRDAVLDKIHEGHQGAVKCRERATQAVWWPGLSNQIRELVLKCRECIKQRANPREPFMTTKLPELKTRCRPFHAE